MNKNQIKKIIAREGLILVCSFAFWSILFFMGYTFKRYRFSNFQFIFDDFAEDQAVLSILIVSTYLFIRFIIWAIRTLKHKND